MAFGILSLSDSTSLLTTDEFNPYYYRGWTGWWGHTGHTLWSDGGIGGGGFRRTNAWTMDGVVIHTGGGNCIPGFFTFPRFKETDLIFLEPLSDGVGMSVSSLKPVNDGKHWKLEFYLNVEKRIYDFLGAWTDPGYPNYTAGENIMCPLAPKIHVFSQLSAAGFTQDRYGLEVYDSLGAIKFNSSRAPLNIKNIIGINFPEPTLEIMDRRPTGENLIVHDVCQRPMYCVSTTPQAVSQFWWKGSETRGTWLGDLGPKVTTTWNYQMWGVYGGAIAKGYQNNAVKACWALQGMGTQTSSSTSGSTLFGLIPTGGSNNTNGLPPYTHSLNNSTNITCLVADAADYI